MSAAPSAEPFVPERPSLPALRAAAAGCKGCHLFAGATQTVFGDGIAEAGVVLVGDRLSRRDGGAEPARPQLPRHEAAGRGDRGRAARGVDRGDHPPSAILRQRDDHSRHAERDAFRRDLEVVAALLGG